MEQIKVTDDLLKDILPKVSDELVKEWENEVVEDHTFSKSFNRKMKTFIWKHKNKQLIKELKAVGKIAAALLLLIGVCFFGNIHDGGVGDGNGAFCRLVVVQI